MSPTWGAKREEIPSFALLAGVKLAYHCEPCSGRVSSRLMNGVTQLLTGIDRGDPDAASKLLPLVYDELRRLAAQRLAQEKPGQTLQVTALVHEAYLRLVGKGEDQPWSSRGHFFAAAAEAMRRILVENARRKRSLKQGGERTRVKFDEVLLAAPEPAEDLVALDEALDRLTKRDPQKAELVKLPRLRTSTPLVSVDSRLVGETPISAVPTGSLLVSRTSGTVPGPRLVTVTP